MSKEIVAFSPRFAPEDTQSWLEIDLDALRRNALAVKSLLAPGCQLMAVVKANGYGLGALPVALALEDIAHMLGVTTVEEGVQLRLNGVSLPILVFLPPQNYTAHYYEDFQLSATIDNPQCAKLLGRHTKTPISCHLKINTGMNRLGASGGDVLAAAQAIDLEENLKLSGVYSHFYNSSAQRGVASQKQLLLFNDYLQSLGEMGLRPPLAHMANSAAIIKLPQSHFDMVRCGTLLYGQSPVPLPSGLNLEDPFKARCRIIAIRGINKSEKVGYGGDYTAAAPKKLAILPIGYSEGFGVLPPARQGAVNTIKTCLLQLARGLVNKPHNYAYIKGLRLPIAGRIAMQTSAIDISQAPFLKTGDIVGISLRRVNASPSLKRVYIKDNQPVEIEKLKKISAAQG